MPIDLIEAQNKEVHPDAKQYFEEYINNFSESLLLQAKVLAHLRDYNSVQTNHIKEALTVLQERRESNRFRYYFMTVFGGGSFGAFLSGLLTELSVDNLRPAALTLYAIFGVVGMFFIVWGYFGQVR